MRTYSVYGWLNLDSNKHKELYPLKLSCRRCRKGSCMHTGAVGKQLQPAALALFWPPMIYRWDRVRLFGAMRLLRTLDHHVHTPQQSFYFYR